MYLLMELINSGSQNKYKNMAVRSKCMTQTDIYADKIPI